MNRIKEIIQTPEKNRGNKTEEWRKSKRNPKGPECQNEICVDLPSVACGCGMTIMIPLAHWYDPEGLTPHLPNLDLPQGYTSPRISWPVESRPRFCLVVFVVSTNESKYFSHRGFRGPNDRGRVRVPVFGSFHASRRESSKLRQQKANGSMSLSEARVFDMYLHRTSTLPCLVPRLVEGIYERSSGIYGAGMQFLTLCMALCSPHSSFEVVG
jgi:hypothetical protein